MTQSTAASWTGTQTAVHRGRWKRSTRRFVPPAAAGRPDKGASFRQVGARFSRHPSGRL